MVELSLDARVRALLAAMSASEATTELLRHVHKGDGLSGPFEIEVAEKLADALKLALEIEGGETAADERGRLYAALTVCLEGWV